jgi:hypothetical protein
MIYQRSLFQRLKELSWPPSIRVKTPKDPNHSQTKESSKLTHRSVSKPLGSKVKDPPHKDKI